MSDEDRLLTVEEAAKRLRVRWTYVRELVETGQLRAVKIGTRWRVPASALRDVGCPIPVPHVAGGTGTTWGDSVTGARLFPLPSRPSGGVTLQPRQPPVQLTRCPVCGALCRGHIVTGLCPRCSADEARAAIERIERGNAPPQEAPGVG